MAWKLIDVKEEEIKEIVYEEEPIQLPSFLIKIGSFFGCIFRFFFKIISKFVSLFSFSKSTDNKSVEVEEQLI